MPIDWAASAIKPGRQSLNRTSLDRRRGPTPEVSTPRSVGHDAHKRAVVLEKLEWPTQMFKAVGRSVSESFHVSAGLPLPDRDARGAAERARLRARR